MNFNEPRLHQIVEGIPVRVKGRDRTLRLVSAHLLVNETGAALLIQVDGQEDPQRVLRLVVSEQTLNDDVRLRKYVDYTVTRFITGELPPDAVELL